SGRRGPSLARLLLWVHFLLLAAILVFSVATAPSADPHGAAAAIAVMIAVSALACQFALLRLAISEAVSTAGLTGNLTNTVLSSMDLLSRRAPLLPDDARRLKCALQLLAGFLVGCIIAAAGISLLRDWTWSLPVILSGLALAWARPARLFVPGPL